MYKLDQPTNSKSELEQVVKDMFGLLPKTGTLGLRSDKAKLQSFFYIRVKVPTVSANCMSVTQMGVEDSNRDLRDSKDPIGLSNALDNTKSYSDKEVNFSFSQIKGRMRVDGGKQPFSWCELVDA